METIKKISEEYQIELIKGESVGEAFDNLSKLLVQSGMVRIAKFEKLGADKYKWCIDGCIFGNSIHKLLSPKDVTCPLAFWQCQSSRELQARK